MAQHILPDVLRPGLAVVFCGTQAGRKSRKMVAYYAGRGNKFWTTLHKIGLTPEPLKPHEFYCVLNFGIGLTDIAKLTAGPDSALLQAHYDIDGFIAKMTRYSPRVIAFNGKRAASVAFSSRGKQIGFGMHPVKIGSSDVFVPPSTSGAASRYWQADWWVMLAHLLQQRAC